MAGLLSFISDISVKAGSQPSGPLGKLSSTDYGSNTFRYPIDLGSSDKNHYMMIQILEQRNTQFSTGASLQTDVGAKFGADAGTAAVFKPLVDAAKNVIPSVVSTIQNVVQDFVKNLTKGENQQESKSVEGYAAVNTVVADALKGSIRATTKIESSIALYMPNTLNFDYAQGYSNQASVLDSKLGKGLAVAGAAATSVVDALSKGEKVEAAKNASPFVAKFLQNKLFGDGGGGQIIFTAATGTVQNPLMEVIYTAPEFRRFQFDFMFYPRSQREASEVQEIISTLRFHQAPEAQQSTNGYFLIPPSEFDIDFYYNGKVNPNIPQIGICVLKNMQVNYAPNGFSAYEVFGQDATLGGTGMPIAIQLTLSFEETEIRTKASYDKEEGRNRSKKTSVTTPSFVATPSPFGDRQGK